MWISRPLLAVLASLLAPAAVLARPIVRPAPAGSIAILEPAGAAVVAAGSAVPVEWVSTAAAVYEEWEVFLSLDGGRSYPLRLTPHLSGAIRRTSLRLPEFSIREARLMLRVGDERIEWSVESEVFTIGSGRGPATEPAWPAFEAGESATADGPATIEWVAGGRDGATPRRYVSIPERGVGGSSELSPSSDSEPGVLVPDSVTASRDSTVSLASSFRPPLRPRPRRAVAPPIPPLSATCRRNT